VRQFQGKLPKNMPSPVTLKAKPYLERGGRFFPAKKKAEPGGWEDTEKDEKVREFSTSSQEPINLKQGNVGKKQKNIRVGVLNKKKKGGRNSQARRGGGMDKRRGKVGGRMVRKKLKSGHQKGKKNKKWPKKKNQ